jgi:energy-coupling factor transport system permease protein
LGEGFEGMSNSLLIIDGWMGWAYKHKCKTSKSQEKFRPEREIYALTFRKKFVYFRLSLYTVKSKGKMPIQDISIGRFAPRNSYIHRLDPRTKMVCAVILMTALFFLKNLVVLAAFFGLLGLLHAAARLEPVLAFRSIRPFLWLFGLTLLMHALFTKSDTWFSVPWIGVHVSRSGFHNGLFYSVRIFDLMALAGLFTLTTSPMSFADSAEKLLSPLKRTGFPAHETAMTLSISLRFIPILVDESIRIQKSQASRGADWSGRSLQRLRGLLPILVPLFVSGFHRANDLALAMDARCYRGGQDRTSYSGLRMRRSDWASMGLVWIAGMALVLLDRQLA